MSGEASFEVEVGTRVLREFAELSGDWNPLHTNPDYARQTPFGRPVLHGAFSAGLLSRLAGMYLPGTDCLLHEIKLRFVAPIIPPATLRVSGRLVSDRNGVGRVEASVTDVNTGQRYVEGGYEFSRHEKSGPVAPAPVSVPTPSESESVVLVTGATGGLGQAILAEFGPGAVGLSRREVPGLVQVSTGQDLDAAAAGRRIAAIVHCGWPSPDNAPLLSLSDPTAAIEHQIADPLRQCLALARLLSREGTPDALLLLIGSTAAEPGRHNFRMPLYTLGKSLVPLLARILALELGGSNRRAAAVVFDVLETGMNQRLSRTARQAHADRSPTGQLPSAAEAAGQIAWVLRNRSYLLSGATVTLSGGALP